MCCPYAPRPRVRLLPRPRIHSALFRRRHRCGRVDDSAAQKELIVHSLRWRFRNRTARRNRVRARPTQHSRRVAIRRRDVPYPPGFLSPIVVVLCTINSYPLGVVFAFTTSYALTTGAGCSRPRAGAETVFRSDGNFRREAALYCDRRVGALGRETQRSEKRICLQPAIVTSPENTIDSWRTRSSCTSRGHVVIDESGS